MAIVIKSDRIHLILSRDKCGHADCDREVICFFLFVVLNWVQNLFCFVTKN